MIHVHVLKLPHIHHSKCFSVLTCVRQKSHYDTLGLTPKATQSEIKTAFYRLSKVFHPDTNKDPNAADKFREIVGAYEVLSSATNKQLYDRGQHQHVKTPGQKGFKVPEDAQAAFYKSRLRSNQSIVRQANSSYNYDAWLESHYSETLRQSNSEQARRREFAQHNSFRQQQQQQQQENAQGYGAGFVMVMIILCFGYLSEIMDSADSGQRKEGGTNV